MTTIKLTPDAVNTSILLEITLTSPVTRITRTDANGTNEVRVKQYQLPSASSGKLILSDYEATNGTNKYWVYTAAGNKSATATLTLDSIWFLMPRVPNFAAKVTQLTDYSSSRKNLSVVHEVIGRPDPVLALGPMGTRQGQLEMWVPNYAAASELEDVFNRRELAMLKQPVAGMDMYFYAETVELTPYSPEGQDKTAYRVIVNFHEVKRPLGYLAADLGWTWDEVAYSFATFDDVAAAYATFDDLLLQKEI